MANISAFDLESWSSTRIAESDLPRWIRRLITASGGRVTKLDMPSGEHSRLPGFDGHVHCTIGNQFVPAGQSVWEVSVDEDSWTKANGDFEKRTADPLTVKTEEYTFVFATTRRFTKAEEWRASRLAGGWKGVHVLWSSNFEQWFDSVPWVAAAFLRQLGRPTDDLKNFEMLWQDYCSIPGMAADLPPDFVIATRQNTSAKIADWILNSKDGDVFRVTGSSFSEAESHHRLDWYSVATRGD